MPPQDSARVFAIHVLAEVLKTPRKWPNYSIIVPFRVRDLSGTHPSAKQSGKNLHKFEKQS